MPAPARSVTVLILGREYQISCPLEEEEALRKSARYLDKQMEAVKNRGSSLGYEKIAVLAALNIAHELLRLSVAANSYENNQVHDFKQLEKKIDAVLVASRQIEI
jgi:cell division protein ZapA